MQIAVIFPVSAAQINERARVFCSPWSKGPRRRVYAVKWALHAGIFPAPRYIQSDLRVIFMCVLLAADTTIGLVFRMRSKNQLRVRAAALLCAGFLDTHWWTTIFGLCRLEII